MICFQGTTFCADPSCSGACGFEVWTPELQAEAERWWGGPDAPVGFVVHGPQVSERKELPAAWRAEGRV